MAGAATLAAGPVEGDGGSRADEAGGGALGMGRGGRRWASRALAARRTGDRAAANPAATHGGGGGFGRVRPDGNVSGGAWRGRGLGFRPDFGEGIYI